MKRILAILLSILPILSYAEIRVGNYTGIDEDANPCSVQILEKRFLAEYPKNPLNERVKISWQGKEYITQHSAVINHEAREISYNPNYLSAHHGTDSGAFWISIYISDEVGGEGPLSVETVEQNWKTGAKEISRCLGLVYRQ